MLKRLFTPLHLLYALLYVGLPAYAVFSTLGEPVIGTDDANIYLQYTRNFSSGYGIVYNPGGGHVEGFSSTLYFLVCSAFNFITPAPEKCILLFNLALALISCLLMLDTIRRICKTCSVDPLVTQLLYFTYFFWMFLNPSFFCWTIITLMDSGIYTFLLILCYWFFIRSVQEPFEKKKEQKMLSFLILLMIAGRPEGIMWAMAFLVLYFLMQYGQQMSLISALKRVLPAGIVFIASLVLLTAYRMWYFGYPLPNTYYTKVSASFPATLKDGLDYSYEFLRMCSPLILIPSLLLFLWLPFSWYRKRKHPLYLPSFITLTFVTIGLVLPILEGGDHFHAFRFFQPVYPFLILPLILLLTGTGQTVSFRRTAVCSVPACILLLLASNAGWANFCRNNNTMQAPEDVSLCIKMEFNIAEYTRENGQRLNDFFKGDLPVIGFGAAGGIAIGYDGTVYDMLGLNLPEMAHADRIKQGPKAHQSFNKKVFYKLDPDVFMPTAELSNVTVSLENVNAYYCNVNSWDNLIYKNIFNDPEFKEHYPLALVMNPAQPAYVCYGYFNRAYLNKLSGSGFRIRLYN